MSPEIYLVVREQQVLLKQCVEVAEQRKMVGTKEKEDTAGRPSMIEAFLEASLPDAEQAPERIRGEMFDAVQAGTLTSSHTLKFATYHIFANATIFEMIITVLKREIPDPQDPPSLRELEQIDYLMAILYETLRLFYGVSQRLQWVFPYRCLQYKEWTIPPGTPISRTIVHVHDNPIEVLIAVRIQVSFISFKPGVLCWKRFMFHVHIDWLSSRIPRPCHIIHIPQGTLANVRALLGTPRRVSLMDHMGNLRLAPPHPDNSFMR